MPRADYIDLATLCRRAGVGTEIGLKVITALGLPSMRVDGRTYLTEGRARRVATHLAKLKGEIELERAKVRGLRLVGHELVYFIRCERFVKIGRALDVMARLAGLQKSNPFELELLATEEGGEPREAELHARFSELRVRGEWFRLEEPLTSFISTLDYDNPRRKSRQKRMSDAHRLECFRIINDIQSEPM